MRSCQFGGCKPFSSWLPLQVASSSANRPPPLYSNVWAPNKQTDVIELLGKHYKFSPRLLAIIKTIPPATTPKPQNKNDHKYSMLHKHKDDIELATSSIDTSSVTSSSQSRQSISQYDITKQLIHYQSIDMGAHCKNSAIQPGRSLG